MLRTFVIIATDANQGMAPIHNRMPVILEEPDWPSWIGETDAVILPRYKDPLLTMCCGAVSDVRNNGPELLESAA